MSSCLHVMSMSSHSACLVSPGPTGANHLDLQISSLDETLLKMLPRLCPSVPNPPSLWLPTLGQSIHDVETGSLILKKKNTQKSKTMKKPLLNCPLDSSTKQKSTNHLNPIQNPKYRDCFVKKTGATKSHPFLLWARALFKTLPCFL